LGSHFGDPLTARCDRVISRIEFCGNNVGRIASSGPCVSLNLSESHQEIAISRRALGSQSAAPFAQRIVALQNALKETKSGETGPTMNFGVMALDSSQIENTPLQYRPPRRFTACEDASGSDRSLGQNWNSKNEQDKESLQSLHGAPPYHRRGFCGLYQWDADLLRLPCSTLCARSYWKSLSWPKAF
jgi:hypothetical protein